jgi:hypothetical protein
MKITIQLKSDDPAHPIMHGDTPIAKEFNKRQESILKTGNVAAYDFEQVTTVLLEILADDYNKRHSRKQKKHNDSPQ